MLLKKLVSNCPRHLRNIKISDLTSDSREVKKNSLFFAIKGKNYDGFSFVNEAIKKGAAAIISSKKLKYKNSIIISDKKIKKLLPDVCKKFYHNKPSNLIAVTGTNGKSSIAEFYRQMMLISKKKVATIGTLGTIINNRKNLYYLTTPDIINLYKTLQKLKKKEINNVIIETSSHGLKQGRLDGVSFKTGIFTNFSHDHLDYHKTMKDYFKSKMILFKKNLKKRGNVIVSSKISEFEKIKKISFKKKLKIYLTDTMESKINNFKLKNLVGDFQATNLAMALIAVEKSGVRVKKLLSLLNKIKPVPGRCELVKTFKNNVKVFIDYAHTPDALEQSLKNIKNLYGNVTVVFGCGGQRDKSKRPKMGKIAERLAKNIIITDDNPRLENASSIRKQILKPITKRYFNIPDRGKAIKLAILNSSPNEVILVAGKGHETYQDYGSYIKKFSDKYYIKNLKFKKKIKKNKIFMNINKKIFKKLKLKTKKGFSQIKIDSRNVKKGDIFVAIKGKNKDGHAFVQSAFHNGAVYAVITKKIGTKKKIIKVNNALSFLNSFANAKRNLINAKIIAITGSSGKTTLKTLLSKVLKNYGDTYYSPKSYNNHYGVPLSLSNMKLNEKYCVFELGMSKKGEINALAKMVKPDLGIITNIGEAHLENFKSINGIAKAKSELINNISPGGYIVLNHDDKYYSFLKKIALSRNLRTISFGYSKKADVSFRYSKKDFIIIKYQNKNLKLFLKDQKKINILNLLCCFAVLNILNLDYKEITKKNKFFESIAGRGKLYRIKRYNKIFNLIDESYNANPSSTSMAIKEFSKIKTKNKKYFILGDMLELGQKTKNYHKFISKQINNSDVDKAFTYGENTLMTFKNLKNDKKGNILQNINDFDFLMKDFIQNNDYIMIKGSNASNVNKISRSFILGNKNAL